VSRVILCQLRHLFQIAALRLTVAQNVSHPFAAAQQGKGVVPIQGHVGGGMESLIEMAPAVGNHPSCCYTTAMWQAPAGLVPAPTIDGARTRFWWRRPL
jgi:hypothetical protein